jgi:hypothetical protein
MLIWVQAEADTAGLMVMLSFAVAVCGGCDASLTEKETTEVPTEFCPGVPEMAPLDAPIDSPEGRPVAL